MNKFDTFVDITLNFSDLIGIPILDQSQTKVGVLHDFFVNFEEIYPSVFAIQLKKNKDCFYIQWNDVITFSLKKILIKNDSTIVRSRTFPHLPRQKTTLPLPNTYGHHETVDYPTLGKIILDRQIVDTHGKKVVRVNDIQFIRIGQTLRVTHAEIGFRSLVRRLGYEPIVDFFVKLINPKAKYLTGNILINWKYVHAIPDKTVHSSVKLNLSNDELITLHPADLADILEDLDSHSREIIFQELAPDLAADTLSEIEPDLQPQMLTNADPDRAADILENMGTDEAADILDDLSLEMREQIITKIDDEEVIKEIKELLTYEDDTAGGLMSTEVFEVQPDKRKSHIMDLIQQKHDDIESIYDLYIVNQNRQLLGTCALNKILIQKEDIAVGDIMISHDIKSLKPDAKWIDVANYMSKYNLINVPIVDDTQKLLGIVSVDDVLPWLLDER